MSPAAAQDIQKTNRIFEQEVAAKRNIGALDQVYTRNARILPPGAEMISGRDNIKNFWRGAIESMGVKAVKLQTVEFEALGDAGLEIGRATLEFALAGAEPVDVKYVVLWKREDGDWKWDVDMWSPVG
jgi:ketosteroid isomerase-like protein